MTRSTDAEGERASMDAQALRLTEERPALGQAGMKPSAGRLVEVRLRSSYAGSAIVTPGGP